MSKIESAHLEELLDWLVEEVAMRLRLAEPAPAPLPVDPAPAVVPAPKETFPLPAAETRGGEGEPSRFAWPGPAAEEGEAPASTEEEAGESPEPTPRTAPPSHAAPLLGRLAIGLLVAVALINIPLSRQGTALARLVPSSASLVMRNGLLVKEAGSPDVYVYEDGTFRWIADLDVFQRYGYRWENVHEVASGFLQDYEIGRPLYLVVKCPNSPHVYRLEHGAKRWIVDIQAFEAEGYQWSDVKTVDCATLAAMPMGETIPPGRGPAPQP